MRREAHARLRAVIHQDIPRHKLPHHLLRVRAIQGNRAAALGWVARRVDAPAAGESPLDQPLSLPEGLFPNPLDADLGDHLEPRLASVERRDLRRPVHEAVGIFGEVNRPDFEIKRRLVRNPSGE